MATRTWKCIITGCTSPAKAPGHFFPKNKELMKKWLEAVSIPWLSNLPENEIRKCRICHLHFNENDYIFTLNRRRLKHNAIPNNLQGGVIENDCQLSMSQASTSQPSTSQPSMSQKENTFEIQYDENTEIIESEFNTKEYNMNQEHEENNIFQKETQQEAQQFTNIQIVNTPKKSNNINHHRSILGSITRKAHLTPTARMLYEKSKIFKKQNGILRRNLTHYKCRLKYATKFSSLLFFKKYSALTYTQKMFIEMQIRNLNKKSKGVKFSLEEKIMALSLYKESCNGYRLLQQLFTLPSSRTLRRLLQKVPIHAGINNVIFSHLSHQETLMKDANDKLCILMWDEISLQPHLQYDTVNDKITGFEDWGHKRTQKIADHALVFMLRGIKTGWKLPLSYNFCKSTTKTPQLIRCIKEIIKEVTQAGFIVVATVCDQGTSNVAALKQLLQDTRITCLKTNEQFDDTITLYTQKFIVLYDPPHLLKGIRSNFLEKDIEINIKEREFNNKLVASWNIIETAYKLDTNSNLLNRQLKKLTDQHIMKKKIKKMKVKLAAQVLSASLSAFIEYNSKIQGYVETKIGPLQIPREEGFATAKVLDFFNKLFDSVNAHEVKSNTLLRSAVTRCSAHHSFWYEAIHQLQNIKFIDKKTRKPVSTPSLNNWILTIKGFQKLWATVNETGMKCLKTRNINQDPLENFFGMIRSHNRRNINPTCSNFESSFKTLLINNLTGKHSIGNNCEEDTNKKILFSLQYFIENSIDSLNSSSTNITEEETVIDDMLLESNKQQTNINLDFKHIINKLFHMLPFNNCHICQDVILSQEINSLFHTAYTICKTQMPSLCFRTDLHKQLSTTIRDGVDFSYFLCKEHNLDFENIFIKISIENFSISQWCADINRKISGKDTSKPINIIEKQAVHFFNTKVKRYNNM